MIWNLTNDNCLKTNSLTFFGTDSCGKYGTHIKDIIFVTDESGNRLVFNEDTFSQKEFIENL